ncbi:MAG: hypothetical protein DRJ61_07170 [Acidobacteria bacterium]|nr:MAG: hypothetical protein DRJ61_07170 [Acidobacteriota bacterium]
MTEAHAFGLHDPVDDGAALSTAEAVPEILRRRDDQRRAFVVVQDAQAHEVFALGLELDSARSHQRC